MITHISPGDFCTISAIMARRNTRLPGGCGAAAEGSCDRVPIYKLVLPIPAPTHQDPQDEHVERKEIYHQGCSKLDKAIDMAEAFGVAAAAVQVADAGLKVSLTLRSYCKSVASADQRIEAIADEIKSTSCLIETLATIFRRNQSTAVMSETALNHANGAIKECHALFAEMEAVITKTKKNSMGRYIFPFRESKIEILRANLSRLKQTLDTWLAVLQYALAEATQYVTRTDHSNNHY